MDDGCPTDAPALLAFVLWLYSGFFSLGSLAGDISDPRRTFLVVIAVLVPFTVLFNSAPLMVALSIDGRRCNGTIAYATKIRCPFFSLRAPAVHCCGGALAAGRVRLRAHKH